MLLTARTRAVLAGAVAVGILAATPSEAAPSPTVPWTTTWATAPSAARGDAPTGYAGYTLRNTVHSTIAGSRIRVHLSNRFGNQPVYMAHVTVAVSARAGGTETSLDYSNGTVAAGQMRSLTFGGRTGITIPAGADVISDGVDLAVPRDHDLYVTTFTPNPSGTVTHHPNADQTNGYWHDGVDHAADLGGWTDETYVWHYVSEVDVSGAPGTVVTLGDSITDGVGSNWAANHRWPDYLAQRLNAQTTVPHFGVANAGISGNRILLDDGAPNYKNTNSFGPSALARLDADALSRSGARTLIVLEGINDIQQSPQQSDPNAIIAGLQQIVTRARDRGLRVVGATLTPWEGWGSYSSTLENTRQAVNTWIRTSGTFDAVADMDAATRDAADPHKLAAADDSGDHLHPNDAGYRAMAAAVPLDAL